jgi:hypothetical protein
MSLRTAYVPSASQASIVQANNDREASSTAEDCLKPIGKFYAADFGIFRLVLAISHISSKKKS